MQRMGYSTAHMHRKPVIQVPTQRNVMVYLRVPIAAICICGVCLNWGLSQLGCVSTGVWQDEGLIPRRPEKGYVVFQNGRALETSAPIPQATPDSDQPLFHRLTLTPISTLMK